MYISCSVPFSCIASSWGLVVFWHFFCSSKFPSIPSSTNYLIIPFALFSATYLPSSPPKNLQTLAPIIFFPYKCHFCLPCTTFGSFGSSANSGYLAYLTYQFIYLQLTCLLCLLTLACGLYSQAENDTMLLCDIYTIMHKADPMHYLLIAIFTQLGTRFPGFPDYDSNMVLQHSKPVPGSQKWPALHRLYLCIWMCLLKSQGFTQKLYLNKLILFHFKIYLWLDLYWDLSQDFFAGFGLVS